MRTRTVGSSSLAVSVVGVGCNNFGWRLDTSAAGAVVDAAIEAGITLFDTAESYGDGESELFLGRALAGRRDRVVVATKFGWGSGRGDNSVARGHPDCVRAAIDASLERLGTDYVDLYQYHRPDGVTPLEETLAALNELVEAGKVRFIGSSNFSAAQVEEAEAVIAARGIARFVSAQNEYSWLEREAEAELVPACERLGIGLIPYFPLASGLLTGKYRRDEARAFRNAALGTAGCLGRAVGTDRGARGVRLRARRRPARRGDRRPRRSAGGVLGDRGGDEPRAGARERRSRRVGAVGRRARAAPCAVRQG
jgi:aryl-alcohol dehydrogenase-like predicted oxidoreductase